MTPPVTHFSGHDDVGWIVVGSSGMGPMEPGVLASTRDALVAGQPQAVLLLRTSGSEPPQVDDLRACQVRPDAAALDTLLVEMRTCPGALRGAPLAAVRTVEPADVAAAGLTAGEAAQNLLHAARLEREAAKQTVAAWFPGSDNAPPGAPFRIIGVVGAGTAGTRIAQWCAMKGCGVMLHDNDVNALKQGMEVVRGLFREAVARGDLTSAEAHRATGGMAITTDWRDLIDCDLVIEAIGENLAAKQRLLADIAGVVPPQCVLASTAASLPVEQVCATVPEPGRTLGLHFAPAVHPRPLVEIALSPHTTRGTAERAADFVRALGRTPLLCKSAPGGFMTRVLFRHLNEACRLWAQGVPTQALDGAMRDWGWAMGPLRLIDEIGIETCATISGHLAQCFPERMTAASICRRLADAGLRGRRHGAGFYDYAGPAPIPNPATAGFASGPVSAPDVVSRLMEVLTDEARRTLADGIVNTPDEADLALLTGAGFPAVRGGPMRRAGGGSRTPA
jgi:3-hydroxyacyl-CoA dehydrogenase